jgi:hypothetical protein
MPVIKLMILDFAREIGRTRCMLQYLFELRGPMIPPASEIASMEYNTG